jgi:hypothetical protein
MELAILWLPIIGGLLFGCVAVGAWFAGSKILAVWTGFAGIVCLLLLAALQIQEQIVSAPATPDDSRIQYRAYLRVGDQRPTPDRTHFVINVKNTGLTPARNLSGHLNTWWDDEKKSLPDDFNFPDFDNLSQGKTVADLPAGSETNFTFPLEPESFRDAEAANRSLFVYGHFDYIDAFRRPQFCNFCYKVLPMKDGVGQMQIWHIHNDCS